MKKLGNKEAISYIIMKPTACVKCAIGQDWYKCEFTVTFYPSGYYPDYMEVEKFVMDEIDGHELNIEEAVERLYQYLKEYEPSRLVVGCNVHGCKVHFDVEVVKADA